MMIFNQVVSNACGDVFLLDLSEIEAEVASHLAFKHFLFPTSKKKKKKSCETPLVGKYQKRVLKPSNKNFQRS